MSVSMRDAPLGLRCFEKMCKKCFKCKIFNRLTWHQIGVLFLTYIAYTCYHMTRKSLSVVKTVLNQNCSNILPPPDIFVNDSNRNTWCDWAPFDSPDAPALLGTLDSSFLFAYAAAMFLSGFVAERVNLRYFLSLGMLMSGISCYLLGVARPYNIHYLWYFVIVQIFAGIFQTSGWPGVVTVVGNWFGKGKRGIIFGVWNSHTSIGNILGSVIPAYFVESDWGLSFMIPGAIMGIVGFIIFIFLAPNPKDVGCIPPAPQVYRRIDAVNSSDEECGEDNEESIRNEPEPGQSYSETSPILSVNRISNRNEEKAIGFKKAINIPGVIEYSLALFFAKLVSYTFLFWLPLYISRSTKYTAEFSADLSTVFDIGGIIGAIAAGVISDYSGMSALTCAVMLTLAAPFLLIYFFFGNISLTVNIILLTITGLLVNGPYALITTAVSAELGTHPSLGNNSKALATVTAIIDGTGSIGAAVGPLLAGLVSGQGGWQSVFYMLVASDLLALCLLLRLVQKDLKSYVQKRRIV